MKRKNSKTEQLQIRVSLEEKEAIMAAAKAAGMSMSDWVLSKALPASAVRFNDILKALSTTSQTGYVLAELNEFLTAISSHELKEDLQSMPDVKLSSYHFNYIAAMVEQACHLKRVQVPGWVKTIKPLSEPVFATDLKSLRLHLLFNSPPPFRNRNIFIDASIGERI